MESARKMKIPRVTSFDGWVLRADIGELAKDGRKIRLQQLPLLVLEELLAHPGELVTREQLIARLWPKGVVDFDTGLNTAVRKLRVALEDVGETPRYIETLPRKGYRFIAAIDAPADRAASSTSVAPPAAVAAPPSLPDVESSLPGADSLPPPPAERRVAERRDGAPAPTRSRAITSRRGIALAAGFVLLSIAAGVAWWARRPDQVAPHAMTVRLSGFQLLSPDLPAALPQTVDAQLTAPFSVNGVVGMPSAAAPPAGRAGPQHMGARPPP